MTIKSTCLCFVSSFICTGLFMWVMNANAAVTNGDFESVSTWSYVESDTDWSGGYDTIVSHNGNQSYKITWPTTGSGIIGDYAEIKQTITVPAASRFYELELWVKDDYSSGTVRANYPYKQILVNGVVVWEDSAQGDETDTTGDWLHVVQDVTPHLTGLTSAEISLRVFHKRVSSTNESLLAVNVWWDDVKLSTDADTTLETRRRNNGFSLGDHYGTLYLASGHLDVTTMINRLVDANINHYNYIILQSAVNQYSWEDLPDFLDAAYTNGIKVWVGLLSPKDYYNPPRSSYPYGFNFLPDDMDADVVDDNDNDSDNTDNWITQIGQLSLNHPALVGVYIDDLIHNVYDIENPYCMMRMATVLHDINPDVAIVPCVYIDDAVLQELKSGPYNWCVNDNDLDINSGWATDSVHSGKRSLKITRSAISGDPYWQIGDWIAFSQTYPTTLRLGGWAKADNVTLGQGGKFTIEMRVVFYDDTYEWKRLYYDSTLSSWQHKAVTYNFSKGVKSAIVYCRLYNATGTVWFDDIYLLDNNEDRIINGDIEFNQSVKPYIDGVMFPYRDTESTTYLSDQIDTIREAIGDNKSLTAMIYTTQPSWATQPPTVSYVADALGIAHFHDECDGGVITYNLQKSDPSADMFENIEELYYYWSLPYCWVTSEYNELDAKSGWATDDSHSGLRSLKILKTSYVSGENPIWRADDYVYFSSPYPNSLTLGGWGKGENLGQDVEFYLDFRVYFTDNTYEWRKVYFDETASGWQYEEATFNFTKDVTKVIPFCRMISGTGVVWFDDICIKYNGENLAINYDMELSRDTE